MEREREKERDRERGGVSDCRIPQKHLTMMLGYHFTNVTQNVLLRIYLLLHCKTFSLCTLFRHMSRYFTYQQNYITEKKTKAKFEVLV